MLRVVLLIVFFIVLSRAFWRLVDGIIEGVTGRPPRVRVPQRGVRMARDPVCGTFVVPERAVVLGEGRARVFFCSEACRDKYRGGRASRSAAGSVAGRTA